MNPVVERRFLEVAEWHKVLDSDLRSALPALRRVLNGQTCLPEGCASRAAAARALLADVNRDLDEFLYAYGEMSTLIESMYAEEGQPGRLHLAEQTR